MARTVDAPNSSVDSTVRVFDQFYKFDMNVDANQYEIVNSYFLSICPSKNTALNYTTMLFRIASVTGENPLVLLEYLNGVGKVEANAFLIYYLNSMKSKTTLYGIGASPAPNNTVQRNIIP